MEEPSVKEKRDGVVVEPVDAEAHSLEEMGYKQELNRNLGMVAILGLSFAIMVSSAMSHDVDTNIRPYPSVPQQPFPSRSPTADR